MITTEITTFLIEKDRHEQAVAKIGIMKPYIKACKKLDMPLDLTGCWTEYLYILCKDDDCRSNKFLVAHEILDRKREEYLSPFGQYLGISKHFNKTNCSKKDTR